MIFKIFNREDEYIKNIEPIAPKWHRILNGEDTLEFSSDDLELEEGMRVVFFENGWREFIIRRLEKEHTESGLNLNAFCENSFYETIGDYVEDRRINSGSATSALNALLESTRWEVGTVEDLGLKTTNFYRDNVKTLFQKKLLEVWECEYQTRIIVSGSTITHRYIDLKKKIGTDSGKRFVYDKDMPEIRKEVDLDGLCTALYGYGKGEQVGDGYGRRLDFADINGGVAYLENTIAKNKYGYIKSGVRQNIFDKVEFDDIEDKEILKAETQKELDKRSTPHITYEAKVIDLSKYGLESEGVDLGDYVVVKDKELDLLLKARVVELVRYLDDDSEDEIKLGNFTRLFTDSINNNEDYINSFRSRSGVWDSTGSVFNNGRIDASYIDNLIEELNTRANSSGGWTTIEQGNGILSINAPKEAEATEAVNIIGGTVRIASSKKSDGTWNWRTFITGSQVVADLITAGILKGGKVQFNLEDGTFLIGNSTTDYGLYWDGSNLLIKGDNIDLSSNQSVNIIAGDAAKEATKNFIFDTNGLTIKSGVATSLRLSDNMIAFLLNGVTGDYWQDGWFNTQNIKVANTALIGNHRFEKYTTATGKGTAIRYIGE